MFFYFVFNNLSDDQYVFKNVHTFNYRTFTSNQNISLSKSIQPCNMNNQFHILGAHFALYASSSIHFRAKPGVTIAEMCISKRNMATSDAMVMLQNRLQQPQPPRHTYVRLPL